MTEGTSAESPTPTLTGRLQNQWRNFRSFLEQLGHRFRNPNELSPKEISPNNPEAHQRKLIEIIKRNLKKKGALADESLCWQFFKKEFGLNPYCAPELVGQTPGGATYFDVGTKKPIIYLNPFLDRHTADYQLCTLLEEAIHWSRFNREQKPIDTNVEDARAKDKILAMADYLGLSEKRRKYLQEEKERALSRVKSSPQSQNLR